MQRSQDSWRHLSRDLWLDGSRVPVDRYDGRLEADGKAAARSNEARNLAQIFPSRDSSKRNRLRYNGLAFLGFSVYMVPSATALLVLIAAHRGSANEERAACTAKPGQVTACARSAM